MGFPGLLPREANPDLVINGKPAPTARDDLRKDLLFISMSFLFYYLKYPNRLSEIYFELIQ